MYIVTDVTQADSLIHLSTCMWISSWMLLLFGKAVIPLIFFSTLLHKSVYDIEGRRVGNVRDFSVSLHETFPVVTGLIVGSPLGNSHHDTIIPWSQIDHLEETPIHLAVKQAQIISYTPASDELLLARDILDKQIVDTQGFRVVKVNDLKLAQIKHTARLVGVDISFRGLLRRLGILEPIEIG